MTREFSPNTFFGTIWNFWRGFFSEHLWMPIVCATKYARNRVVIIWLPVRMLEYNLCNGFTGTVTLIFALFFKNLKVEEVKLIKCFRLHRRLKSAIFFPDYRDTFTSALFVTPFLLNLFVVTYVRLRKLISG